MTAGSLCGGDKFPPLLKRRFFEGYRRHSGDTRVLEHIVVQQIPEEDAGVDGDQGVDSFSASCIAREPVVSRGTVFKARAGMMDGA